MRTHRRIETIKDPSLGHEDLATDRLLGWRAEERDCATGLSGNFGQADCGADPGDRDQIMPAAVPQPREGVVLGQVPDVPVLAGSGRRHKCGRQVRDTSPDEKPPILNELRTSGTRSHLFHRDLWMRVNELAELDQRPRLSIYAIDNPLLN